MKIGLVIIVIFINPKEKKNHEKTYKDKNYKISY